MARREVHNGADILDSRDVIKALADMEDDREAQQEADTWDDEDEAGYVALKAFVEEGESLSDWPHGEGLICDSYFKTYAREMAEDIGANIGAVKDADHWPCTCIDWEEAAEELKQDYTSIDFGGVTYWGRS